MSREEFTEAVLSAEASLFHVAYSILRNEADCADAVQEAVLKAYAARDALKKPSYFKTWLTRIVINECYTMFRKRRWQISLKESGEPADESMYIHEEYLDLYRAIGELKEKDKICVLLFYMEDYTVAQIADVLDIPEGTVKSRLNRARLRLRELLGADEENAAMG